jgi:hypothetical protein
LKGSFIPIMQNKQQKIKDEKQFQPNLQQIKLDIMRVKDIPDNEDFIKP